MRLIWRNWRGIALTLGVLSVVLAMRYLGWFEREELAWLDRFFRWRSVPSVTGSKQIIIIGITEEDIKNYPPYPFSDRLLADLIAKVKAQNPRVIALDIIRNIPVPPGSNELTRIFHTTPNLIGVGKLTEVAGDPFYAPIPFPPVLEKKGQVADISAIVDEDGVKRRAFLYPLTDDSDRSKVPSLGFAAAYLYLLKDGIEPKTAKNEYIQLGKTIFYPFRSYDGAYISSDDTGYQLILDWQTKNSFYHVSVTDVLKGRVSKDLFHDRIVFIGAYAPSLKDAFETPYSREQGSSPRKLYGVEIQARLTHQILEAVLNNRPNLRVFPEIVEIVWIGLWVLLPSLVGRLERFSGANLAMLVLLVFGGLITVFLIYLSYFLFLQSWWIPVLYPLLSLWIGVLVSLSYLYITQLHQVNLNLEVKVRERTQELDGKNRDLEMALQQLKQAQQTLIAQEKLASLGTLVAGIAHEFRNPINLIKWNTQLLQEDCRELKDELAQESFILEDIFPNSLAQIDLLIEKLIQKITRIEEQSLRSDEIIQRILSYVKQDTVEPVLFNINDLLEEALQLVRQERQIKDDLIIITNLDSSIGEIEGIMSDLRRAFINLIDNAWDAVIERKQKGEQSYIPKIIVESFNFEGEVKIAIKDNGNGIPEAIKTRIFEPFFTRKSLPKGTGLGLYFTQEIIVNEHQGTIEVISEEKGCQFIMTLPKKWKI